MYSLDPNKARQANSGGNYLNEAGKFIGLFSRAELVTSQGGAKGIEFDFIEAQSEKTCKVTIWTHGKDGSDLFGLNAISALMAVMRVREMTEQPTEVSKYDYEKKENVKATVPCFRELMAKGVGVVIQMEQYINQSNEVKKKPSFFCFFDANSELTATEILDQKVTPVELAEKVAYVMENPERPLSAKDKARLEGSVPASPSYTAVSPGAAPTKPIYDDDIPF